MRMVEWLIHRKVLIFLCSIFIIGAGIYTLMQMETELTPEVGLDSATVEVETTNSSIDDVEKEITIPLEEELADVAGISDVISTISEDQSTLDVRFDKGKGDKLIQTIEAKVHNALRDAAQVDNVSVAQAGATTAYEFILDISDGEMADMTAFAENTLQPRLEKLPEVRDVMITGTEAERIDLTFDEDALLEHDLTPTNVMQVIGEMNQTENLGESDTSPLYWDTTFDDMEAITSLPLPTAAGAVTVEDIADVALVREENVADTWKNGSSDVLMVQIARTENTSQQQMIKAVRDEIDAIESDGLIQDMTLNEVIAHADFVDDAMGDVTKNIIIGAIIAIVVLLLFLRNVRATLIISVSIPTSILLTILAMGVLDYSMNLLTLIGLGLGIGMMVDSSIVMLEAIYKKKEQGLGAVASVIAGTKEVATAIMASALTTIVVFFPIGLIGGDSGKYMLMLAVVVAMTLISSVVVAFTFIPTLAKDFLRYKQKDKTDSKMVAMYENVLRWCVGKKWRSLVVVMTFVVLFGGSFFLIPKIPLNVMPDMFNRYTEFIVDLEHGVSEDEKQAIIEQGNETLQAIDDVEANFFLDYGDQLIGNVIMTEGNAVTKEQELVTEEIIQALRHLEKTEPIRAVERALDGVSGYPVQIEVAGEDDDVLRDATMELQDAVESIDGIVGVTSDLDALSDVRTVSLKEDAIKDAGLTPVQIKEKLSTLFMHEPITVVELDDENVPVYAQHEETGDVLDETMMTQNGEVALSEFASFETEQRADEITRKNGERIFSIMADIEGQDLGSVNSAIQDVLDGVDDEAAYSVSLAGDLEEQDQLMNDMLIAMAVALFLVYVVMAVQFNHFGHPIIVMAILPITVTGVILGLFITQAELNMMSGMGIIILIGIVLNNAILLIDRTNQLRKDDVKVGAALIQAGRDRIRPIFMTTLTTIGGMLPLALATGMSADYQAPMAIVIISGLLFSTLITLVLIPAIYRLCSWK